VPSEDVGFCRAIEEKGEGRIRIISGRKRMV